MRRVKDSQLVSKRKKDRWSLVGGGYKARTLLVTTVQV